MARLTRYAMNKASFRFYVSQKERQISFDRAGSSESITCFGTQTNSWAKWDRRSQNRHLTARSGDCLILYANRQSEVVRQGQMETVIRVILWSCSWEARLDSVKEQRFCSAAGSFTTNGRQPVVLADPKKLL